MSAVFPFYGNQPIAVMRNIGGVVVERCDAGGDGFDVGDDTPRNIGGYQSGIHRFEGEWVVEKVVAVGVFHLGRPPIIGGDGFVFE